MRSALEFSVTIATSWRGRTMASAIPAAVGAVTADTPRDFDGFGIAFK
jgi:hypothetical protein